MGSWVLIPCLVDLRAEFNAINPDRDKGADGSIGDTAHTSSSDHTPDEDSRVLRDHDGDTKNEVHALDIDSTGPWPGTGTQKERFHAIVMRIIARERRRWLDPDDMCRLNYVIWDRRIYDKDDDFAGRAYTLSDPHTNHAHFSGRYETRAENDTSSWGVYQEASVATQFNTEDKAELKAAATGGVLSYTGGGLASWPGMPTGRNFVNQETELFNRVAGLVTDVAVVKAGNTAMQSMLEALTQDPADMDDPEQHPIVRAVRYAQANPPA